MTRERGPVTDLRSALVLSWICVPLMAAQAVLGLFADGVYSKDGIWGRATWQGNDFVNLFVFVPLLVAAILIARRGTMKGRLLWLGIQTLVTYDYIYYPLAVAYDRFFLLYLAILGAAMFATILGMTRIGFDGYGCFIPGKGGRMASSAMMILFAAILAALWIGLSVHFLLTGELKLAVTQMVSTFDLLLICTPVVLSALWLLRGESRGYVLMTVMALVSGLYCFVLFAYTPFAQRAGLSDATTMLPLWILLCVLSLPVAAMLLLSRRTECVH